MADRPAPLLRAHEITVRLGGRPVLDRLSLEILPGLRTVILGANGAGKSVMLRTLHGLVAPDSGRIEWSGGRAPRQAMVFQRPVMLRRSALANVEYGLAVSGVGGAARERRARESLDKAGLGSIAARAARVLSGGEQQRLALARAWALEPAILFLDEPTASLDPGAAYEVERVVAAIASEGTRIVMTTHNLGQARRLADEIVFIHGGTVAEQTPADRFFSDPQSQAARVFLKGELPWN